jgi:hypothetical protein
VDYGAEVFAEDDLYTVGGLEKAMGLVPTIGEDGTEIYPEVIGCPVHQVGGPGIADPNNPNDPNYIPESPEGGNGAGTTPAEPDLPIEVPTPVEPSVPPVGTEEEWWDNLWSETE